MQQDAGPVKSSISDKWTFLDVCSLEVYKYYPSFFNKINSPIRYASLEMYKVDECYVCESIANAINQSFVLFSAITSKEEGNQKLLKREERMYEQEGIQGLLLNALCHKEPSGWLVCAYELIKVLECMSPRLN